MVIPFTQRGPRFDGRILSSVLDMLSLRYLHYSQEEMTSGQMDLWVWKSEWRNVLQMEI